MVTLLVACCAAVVMFVWPDRNAPTIDTRTTAEKEGRPQFGPDESRPIGNTHVDKTREDLVTLLGQPTREGPWFIEGVPAGVVEKYPQTQTLEWHWESGRFLASVHPVNGKWVCYVSYWVPWGWVS
jgi:hypothetical protein